MCLTVRRQSKPQCFLCAGLAHRAGDGDDFRPRAGASGARKIAEAFQHIGNNKQGCSGEASSRFLGYDRNTGTGGQSIVYEVVAIPAFAVNGEKRIAFRQGSAVIRNSTDLRRGRASALGPHRGRHRIEGPQRSHPVLARVAAATASWSENGKTRSPTICPVS